MQKMTNITAFSSAITSIFFNNCFFWASWRILHEAVRESSPSITIFMVFHSNEIKVFFEKNHCYSLLIWINFFYVALIFKLRPTEDALTTFEKIYAS